MDGDISVLPTSGLNYPVVGWDWYSPRRSHYNLWVSYSGTGTMTVNGQSYELSPGFALLLHPMDAAKGRKPAGVAFCNIALHFNPGQGRGVGLSLERFRMRPTRLRNLRVLYELMKYLRDLLGEAGPYAQSECNAMGTRILRIFMRDWELGPEDPLDARLREQTEIARNHPERSLTVSRMAEDLGLSVSQYHRRFTKLFQTPPNTFLIQTRIEKARGLLRESTLTVSEISDILGYSDVAFFSRQFKARAGVSPKAFRRNFLLG
jgi:AraC-like DNA-binding protein